MISAVENSSEVSAVENSSEVQVQQASEVSLIANAVFIESQIGIEVHMKNDKDIEVYVTQWQELKQAGARVD